MLVLSRQYAVAASDAQRTLLEAAGHAMLVVGASHTPGTFPAFFSMEIAGMLISIVMLRAKIFNRTGAFAGIIGFSLLLAFEIISSFVAGVNIATTFLAMVGGIASMVWYGMTARRLFQLSEEKDDEV
jgi:hypothetical protein